MSRPALHQLGAWQASVLLQRREISAQALLRACLGRVAESEAEVQAFACLDADAALAQARALDAGAVRGALHGLPLGVKDLIDTADLPTGYGSVIYAGHRPLADAAVVALCRAAGGYVLGKTVSTELAYFHPGATRNPHHSGHTPGGSSSGSAAAVGAHMLPLALGTQTAGSVIRPAAFCGVVGYKPSLGRVPVAGVKSLSPTLDTLGAFGRSVRDVALLGGVLTGDAALGAALDDAGPPRIGLCLSPEWAQGDADTQRAVDQARAALAAPARHFADLALPAGLSQLVALQKAVMTFEMARALSFEHMQHRARLSDKLLELLDAGRALGGQAHAENLRATAQARAQAEALFDDHDVLLTPSTCGEAPPGMATGDPIFCRTWTLLGLPCIHLPFSHGQRGLPVGLQLVGRYGGDRQLLSAAHWCLQRLGGS